MTSRDFAYWLQGFFEISGTTALTMSAEQVTLVRKHLDMVFAHEIDPSFGGKDEQDKLNKIHNPLPPGPLHGGNPMLRC